MQAYRATFGWCVACILLWACGCAVSKSPQLMCSDAAAGAELCNGLDDDCDGRVDEAGSLLDDVANCGGCGNTCALMSAEAACTDGKCVIASCAEGFSDVDEDPENGCERECVEAESCNDIDDDCDGEVDESTDGVACDTGMKGICGEGTTSCEHGQRVCQSQNAASDEMCDNDMDDDCDGEVDEQCQAPSCIEDEYEDHTYSFCGEARTWTGARNGCAALGAHLVTITDEDENELVATIAHAINGTTSWWMGLNDRDDEDTWVWDDGTPASYFEWFGKEPNDGPPGSATGEDCGAVPEHSLVTWNDANCETLKPFICEADD